MRKSVGVAYILLFFFWFIGLHKFYLNRPFMGFFYFFTFGGFIVGSFIDLFTLASQVDIANLKITEHDKQDTLIKAKELKNEKLVLNLAKKNRGIINPLDIAIESDLSVSESEKLLQDWVKKGYADYKVSQSGTVHYEFSNFFENDKEHLSPVI